MASSRGFAGLFGRRARSLRRSARTARQMHAERLERREMLTVTVTRVGDTLTVAYGAVANQACIIELEQVGRHSAGGTAFTADVNIYAPSNPAAFPSTWFFEGIEQIFVTVAGFNNPGVNNNALTIKGIHDVRDRIIMAGSGTTAAGRWSDQSRGDQCLLSIEGIDDLTVTAGGIINVSGSFTNDTNDASIHAIGQIIEADRDQHSATITIGETTPYAGITPRPWLHSNFIEVVGAELDIYSAITATDEIDLRAGDSASDTVRSNLVLPYDITVSGNADGDGVLHLFSTKNITQLQSSTIRAPRVTAVSNLARAASTDGPWMIDLGSAKNDFDEISLGMTAAPGDTAVAGTEGRIGVRDVDDLTVADFGILAQTGLVRIDTAGELAIEAPIQATGLILESDDSIRSSKGAVMRLGDLGISVLANATFDATSTGDITLEGPITILDTVDAALVTNKIIGAGTVTTGSFYCPHAGTTTISGRIGVVATGPIQVGSTKLDANSTKATVYDHDLTLLSPAGGITVRDVPGNDATPFAVQATNIVTLDAFETITIEGAIFSGTIYGNPSALTATAALPSINVRGLSEVNITATGSLRTQAYETDFDKTTNPLVGKITVVSSNQVSFDGPITADGAVDISIVGDAYLYGGITARENVVVRTSNGSIDVQGPILSTGATYTTAPAAGSQREPNVILTAPLGGIATSGAGTLTAGQVTDKATPPVVTSGKVLLSTSQDITIGADIDTPGDVVITSKVGAFDLSALVRSGVVAAGATPTSISISTGRGMLQSDPVFGRIVTQDLRLINTGAGDPVPPPVVPSNIDLRSVNNQIGTVTATNFSLGGGVYIRNNGALSLAGVSAVQDDATPSLVLLIASGGISQTAAIQGDRLQVTNTSTAGIVLNDVNNDVDHFAALNPLGGVTYVDADGFETGINRTAPLGVEVIGDSVTLSSVAPFSRVRVVSGLSYRTLSISAGTQSGATVGTVEFVTTSTVDNTNTGPFAGTLRDMIRYARSNDARFIADGGGPRRQPMALVFDEPNFPVATVTVTSNLPVVNVPLSLRGGQLEATVRAAGVERLGIQGSPGVNRGYTLGRGAEESLVDSVALYGFVDGTSLFVTGGRNTFQDMYVGMDDAEVPNANRIGMLITGPTAIGNLVGSSEAVGGGPGDGPVNWFVANRSAGIFIDAGASGNRVVGNIIGDLAGTTTFANGDGVRIRASSGNIIGAVGAASRPDSLRNVIVGNEANGILVLDSMAGTLARANKIHNNLIAGNRGAPWPNVGPGAGIHVVGSSFIDIGGTGVDQGNQVVAQGVGTTRAVDGMRIVGSRNVRVVANAVGVDTEVLTSSGNTGNGVTVVKSTSIEISGRNTIGGNGGDGISIRDASTGVTVGDNLVGLFATGEAAGNTGDGIAISAASGNTIGGGNQVANNRNGVRIADGRSDTLVAGNKVVGTEIFANREAGVRIVGGSRSTIGGLTASSANLIRNNVGDGVRIDWSAVSGSATGHAIQGNFIGTDRDGGVNGLGNGGAGVVVSGGTGNTVSDGNLVMNNGGVGIRLLGGSGNTVGGTTTSAHNLIANNISHGVEIGAAAGVPTTLASAKSQTVSGNTIRENGGHGVVAQSGTLSATIGQRVTTTAVSGLGNVIEGNGGHGVSVTGGAQQVAAQGNAIFANLLGGVDVTVGGNRSSAQTIRLTSAEIRQPSGSSLPQLVVKGTLANAGYRQQQYSVDVYASQPDEGNYLTLSGPGYQGRRFLGRATITSNAQGTASFELRITAAIDVGEVITVAATALRFEPGSGSVMSNAVTADYPGIPTPRY